MDLPRVLMLLGGAAALAVWFILPAQLTREWPTSCIAAAFWLAMLPARLATRKARDPDWRSHWALPVVAIPFALMIDATVTQQALHPLVWAGVFGCIAFVIWYARPAFQSDHRNTH